MLRAAIALIADEITIAPTKRSDELGAQTEFHTAVSSVMFLWLRDGVAAELPVDRRRALVHLLDGVEHALRGRR